MTTTPSSQNRPDPAKAATLAAALPWLKRYHGKTIVAVSYTHLTLPTNREV